MAVRVRWRCSTSWSRVERSSSAGESFQNRRDREHVRAGGCSSIASGSSSRRRQSSGSGRSVRARRRRDVRGRRTAGHRRLDRAPYRPARLGPDTKPVSARREHPQRGAAVEQGRYVPSRVRQELLDVVQQDQCALAQERAHEGRRGCFAGLPVTPRARTTVESRSAGSRSGARGFQVVPSGKLSEASRTAWMASRVLPVPPGPVRVSSRVSGLVSSETTWASSCWRPRKGVAGTGRVSR